MNWRHGVFIVLGISCLFAIGTAVASSPVEGISHEYTDHGGTLVDVGYDDQYDIVWSLDENGTFVGYEVSNGEVGLATEQFDAGHALAVGDGAVYIAEAGTLWEFDVAAGNLTQLGTLEEHPGAMAYDAQRDVIWATGRGTVYGYNAADGSEFATYSPHSDGIETIDVRGDYIATGTTWQPELVVYDIEQGDVVLEPEFEAVGGVTATYLTEDGDVIVGTRGDDADDLITAFDIQSGEQHLSYRSHIFGVSHVEYEPSTETILSTGFDNTVKFFDVSEGSVVDQYQHEDTIYTADLDRTNGMLWVGDGEERVGTVTGLDIEDEEATATGAGTPTDPEPTPTAEPTTDKATETVEETTVDEQGPGFGLVVGLIGVVLGALLGRRGLS